MAERHATITQDSPIAVQQSRAMTQAENNKFLTVFDPGLDANAARKPDYYLYIFSIVARKFEVRRPPHHPLITLEPCPAGKPYQLVAKIPNIVNVKEVGAVSGALQVVGLYGERFATDLLNPTNTGTDIWAEISDDESSWIDRGSDDLTKRGLFWTRNETPEPWELVKAKERLMKFYKTLLAQAEEYARAGNNREIGFEHHLAADFYRVRSTWHIIAEAPEICPNCGEATKSGLAYHINGAGVVCVLDWPRTIQAGVKRAEDAPEEYRPKAKVQ